MPKRWLQEALDHDPVDALNDAELVFSLLSERLVETFGGKPAAALPRSLFQWLEDRGYESVALEIRNEYHG